MTRRVQVRQCESQLSVNIAITNHWQASSKIADNFSPSGSTAFCAPKSALCLLDKVQSKAIRIINNPNLAKSLQPLPHRHLVRNLSIFYRYFHGHCSQEITDIIPVPLRNVRTTRSSTHSHPFQASRTLHSSQEHAIYRTSCLLLAFLNHTTCHFSNLRSINLICSLSSLSFLLSSFFLCWGFV